MTTTYARIDRGSFWLPIALATLATAIVLGPTTRLLSANDLAFRQAMAKAVRTASQRVLPSVVTVEIIGAAGAAQGEVEQDAPTSGLIVDADGYIVASSIVLRRPSASLLVVLSDGSRHAAKPVAQDRHRDLVLLQIKTDKNLVAADLSSNPDLRIGQTTVAVGRYGSDASPMVSRGVLSATDRLDGIALQTDARVSPALYGGPMIDLYGNVLGVLIPAVAAGGAEDATSWYDSGIAFAIPAHVIARKLDRLKAGKDVNKGLIGIVSKSRDPYEAGTEIAAVRTRSPAESAGIKAGDKVLTIDGHPVRRHQEIRQVLGSFDAGETVRVQLQRADETIELDVTLAETIPPLQPQRLGLVVNEQETGEGEEKVAQVIVDQVVPDSAADEILRSGDVVTKVGEAPILDADSLRRLMITAEPETEIALTILRDESEQQVNVTPDSIAGNVRTELPESWQAADGDAWKIQTIKLPDAGNDAAYIAPAAEEGPGQLGLLILLLSPGEGSAEEALKSWPELARQAGVTVCAVAAEDNRRWQPKEIEVVAKFAAAVAKKAPIDSSAVAVAAAGALAGGKAESADSMALAVAISQSSTFFGVAVSAETRPPAVRLRENEPSSSLQIMFPVDSEDDLPAWAAAIKKAGYPVVRGGQTDESTLLRWVRLLQSI